MPFILILIVSEIFTPIAFAGHLRKVRGKKFMFLLLMHFFLSLWLWLMLIRVASNNTFYDTPANIWSQMNLSGMIVAVVLPRVIYLLFHYTGVLIRIRKGGPVLRLSWTGLIIGITIFVVMASSSLIGRFNFKTERVSVNIKGLPTDLDGFTIVQISDIHLPSYYRHEKKLEKVMKKINDLKPDLLVNTGDFISFGWREFGRNDTIFAKARGKYGQYAIMGNHDYGGYQPDFTKADIENNVLIMNNKIKASGYTVLNNQNCFIKVGNAGITLAGVTTSGRFPRVVHGDIGEAMKGAESSDIRILLTHDPNHWDEAITGKTDIDLCLSGHTHGMQAGIMTRWFRWSPAKYIYPHWNGLYRSGNQYLYVNRGLGVLGIPARIWMPPEISVITLKPE